MKINYVHIPDGVAVSINGNSIELKGPKGRVERAFRNVTLRQENNKLTVETNDKAMKGTVLSHLKNMVKGVKEGYQVELEFVHAHFPITIELKEKDIIINNFLGEKLSRKASIIGETKVELKGKKLYVSGPDKEGVSQTVENIRRATKIKDKDLRVFQDGFYVVET